MPGYEAPSYIAWAFKNRAHLLRVPSDKPGRPETTRVEIRSPDVMVNPYLMFSVLLAAGLEGIKQEYPPIEPLEGNIERMSDRDKERRGIKKLPGDLQEAITVASQSYLVRRTLGGHIFEKLLENKHIEWQRFMSHVIDYELARYLPML